MIIISNRWSHHANHRCADPTQRGLLTGITISNRYTRIRLLNTYWPVPHAANEHSLSLHAHVVQYLQQHNLLDDLPERARSHPLTYLQDRIMRLTNINDSPTNKQSSLGTSTPVG